MRDEYEYAVACVLKSGGDYDERYVRNLYAAIGKTIPEAHFYCLTDMRLSIRGARFIPLVKGLPGWWSKLECFRKEIVLSRYSAVLYIDLDSVILGSLKPILEMAERNPEDFFALHPMRTHYLGVPNEQTWASGIMAWSGPRWSFLCDDMNPATMTAFKMDQKYIAYELIRRKTEVHPIQDLVGVSSYKWNHGFIPDDTRVVVFHGCPRPHHIPRTQRPTWMRRNWS